MSAWTNFLDEVRAAERELGSPLEPARTIGTPSLTVGTPVRC